MRKVRKERKVRVLLNPRSGTRFSWRRLHEALAPHWDRPGIDLTYQVSRSPEDGKAKVRRAVSEGVDTLLVAGGDGMINTLGAELVGTSVALGVIPAGSGNGFARHFGIPLDWPEAAEFLAQSERRPIDVGVVNDRYFFVTCGMAWDAALVKVFDRSPVRGLVPYFISGASGLLEYEHQPFRVTFDDGETVVYEDPTLFTVANLTQYGGGAVIAPNAREDDGELELVVILRRDAPAALARLPRLFDGTVTEMAEVKTRSCRSLSVHREKPAPLHVDGELLESVRDVHVTLRPRALTVLG